MIVHLCDRCHAEAVPADALALRNLIVPKGKPSTNPVGADVEISLGVQLAQDLCPTCLASALVQFAGAVLGTNVSADAVPALTRDLTTAITGIEQAEPRA